LYNQRGVLQHLPIIEVLLASMCKMLSIDIAKSKNEHQQSINRASTEHQ
jgi:hypothetical protein